MNVKVQLLEAQARTSPVVPTFPPDCLLLPADEQVSHQDGQNLPHST